MKIIVQNFSSLPNKYIRLLKWKIYRLQEKHKEIQRVNVYIDEDNSAEKLHMAKLNLILPKKTIFMNEKSLNPEGLMTSISKKLARQLNKIKNKR